MRRLICTFVVRIWHKTHFRMAFKLMIICCFQNHIDKIARKITSNIWLLSRIKDFLNKEHRVQFYKSFIQPHLDYCSIVWGNTSQNIWGARWLRGRVSDSGARGRGFESYLRRVVSLSKTLYSPKVLVNYPWSGGSVPTWLKNCWLGR